MQRGKLRTWVGRRAWRFEEKLAEDRRNDELARKCWAEIRERVRRRRRLSDWEK